MTIKPGHNITLDITTAAPAAVREPPASASFAIGGLGLLGLLLLGRKSGPGCRMKRH